MTFWRSFVWKWYKAGLSRIWTVNSTPRIENDKATLDFFYLFYKCPFLYFLWKIIWLKLDNNLYFLLQAWATFFKWWLAWHEVAHTTKKIQCNLSLKSFQPFSIQKMIHVGIFLETGENRFFFFSLGKEFFSVIKKFKSC